MKFAHMADVHIGAWRDPKLKELSVKAFTSAIDLCIEKKIDFVLISGDLFHTSIPSIDGLKAVVKKLKQLKNKNIPAYIVAGSHDFSPSGKTMLDVLEEAELVKDVFRGDIKDNQILLKFTKDEKTETLLTGMLGKKGMLEKEYYESIGNREELEKQEGFKIFLFHTAITELKPKELEKMDSNPISFLPKGFNYYAGGHVHIVEQKSLEGYKNVVYPGPVFPANFAELEKLETGGIYIFEDNKTIYEPIKIINTCSIKVDAEHRTPEQVEADILQKIEQQEFINTILLLRVEGKLKSGRPSDIDFKKIFAEVYEKGAFFVMKNTIKLTSEEFEEIKITSSSVDELEDTLIKEHIGQINTSFSDREGDIIKSLMKILGEDKNEGERVHQYQARLKSEVQKLLDL